MYCPSMQSMCRFEVWRIIFPIDGLQHLDRRKREASRGAVADIVLPPDQEGSPIRVYEFFSPPVSIENVGETVEEKRPVLQATEALDLANDDFFFKNQFNESPPRIEDSIREQVEVFNETNAPFVPQKTEVNATVTSNNKVKSIAKTTKPTTLATTTTTTTTTTPATLELEEPSEVELLPENVKGLVTTQDHIDKNIEFFTHKPHHSEVEIHPPAPERIVEQIDGNPPSNGESPPDDSFYRNPSRDYSGESYQDFQKRIYTKADHRHPAFYLKEFSQDFESPSDLFEKFGKLQQTAQEEVKNIDEGTAFWQIQYKIPRSKLPVRD